MTATTYEERSAGPHALTSAKIGGGRREFGDRVRGLGVEWAWS